MSQIHCGSFEEIVHELVRQQALDPAVRAAALAHAADCRACGERMAEAQVLAGISSDAARLVAGRQSPARVEASVMAAFRARHGNRVPWRILQWAGAGALAMLMLVVLWNPGGRTREPAAPGAPGRDTSSQPAGPLDATGPGSFELDAGEMDNETAADLGGEFVPVPFSDASFAENSGTGMIVRVRLTQAALAELGYVVTAFPDAEMLRADVLLGEDGWPQGVRLVQ